MLLLTDEGSGDYGKSTRSTTSGCILPRQGVGEAPRHDRKIGGPHGIDPNGVAEE